MLAESDLYNSNTTPTNNVNPKSLGAMWINYTNGRYYICSNNTINKNVWLDPVNEINTNVNNKLQQTVTELTEKINNIKQLGYNQEWHLNSLDLSATAKPNYITRLSNVWYQNTTSSPIALAITGPAQRQSNVALYIVPPNNNGNGPDTNRITSSTPIYAGDISNYGAVPMFGIVPPTFFYKAVFNNSGIYWSELR